MTNIISFQKPGITRITAAFFAAFALCDIGSIHPADIFSVLIFAGMLLLFSPTLTQRLTNIGAASSVLPRHFYPICRLLAVLYTLFYAAAKHAELSGSFDSRIFRLAFLAAAVIGLYFIFFRFCELSMLFLASRQQRRFAQNTLQQPDGACPVPPAISAAHALSRKQKLLCYFGLLFCWLFWFLYQFPGVLTPDSISQFSQATGLIPFNNHHPILHTLLFSLFYHIGFFLTGSINTGIACYVLFQMCTMAAIETYTLSLLARSGASRLWLILSFCFWGLVPFHAIFAVTVWKDILFSGFMLLYLCFLYELLCNPDNRPGIWAGLSLSGFFVCTLRSNGLYIFLFTLPFVLFAFRRTWKKMFAVQVGILLLSLIITGPVYTACHVERASFTESLSIPLQQIACVVSNGRQLSAEQEMLIDDVVDTSLIPEYYNPVISDPIKALVSYNHADAIIRNPSKYFTLWIQLGISYPGDYLQAFIDQTKGYWFPAPAALRTNEGISPNEIGLSWPHLLRGQFPVKISEILLKLPDMLPVYGILWSIGAYFWAVLYFAAYQFLYGQRRFLVLFVPFIGTVLTLLLATPVASDLRYAYPLILAAPFFIALPYCRLQTSRLQK